MREWLHTFETVSYCLIRLGFESYGNIGQGLWARNYKSLINQMKEIGFNCFRIPYSNAMLRPEAIVSGVDFYLNPDLKGLTPLQCLQLIVDYIGSVGMRVILDRHSSMTNNYNHEPLWYIPGDPYYTEERSDEIVICSDCSACRLLGMNYFG